jgi:hypothetical protein
LRNDLARAEICLDEIIRLFTAVDGHGDNGEQQQAKDESDDEFFQYVPV